MYLHCKDLNRSSVIAEFPVKESPSIDSGERIWDVLVNYKYIANLFDVTDERTLYFDVKVNWHGEPQEAYHNDEYAIFMRDQPEKCYAIHSGQFCIISVPYNIRNEGPDARIWLFDSNPYMFVESGDPTAYDRSKLVGRYKNILMETGEAYDNTK